jgi:rSAM/selenodomain-associated transferase 2
MTMHYNDSVTALLRIVLGRTAALPAAVILLAGVCLVIYLVVHDRLQSIYLAVGAMLLFLPTLHPWYLCLLAPFLVFFPAPAWLYLQAAACFTFPVLGVEFAGGGFQEIGILKVFEYLPFYALLLWQRRSKVNLFPGQRYGPPESIDIVIPALDEGRHLGRAVESVKDQPGLNSILVVDGGSRDDTCRIARAAGAAVIEAPRGRGNQIAAAIGRTRADVVMVLHADSVLDPGCLQKVLEALARHPQAVGGAVGMRFSDRDWRSALIAWLNNQRARWSGIGFGDQAQFFRSAVIEKMGGFPAIELMEDVELSLRLKQQGRLLFVDNGVRVSARRWQGGGFWSNVGLVIGLFFRYLIQRRYNGGPPDNMDWYYRRYYKGRQ